MYAIRKLSVCFFLISQTAMLCTGLDVVVVQAPQIDTYLSPLKFEGITYNKRAKNTSATITAEFQLNEVSESDHLSFAWLFNGAKLVCPSVSLGESPPKYQYVYYTASPVSNSTQSVVLHLRDEGLKAGNYTLLISNASGYAQSASVDVTSAPILPTFAKTKRVLQGDTLRLSCHVQGYPKPNAVEWSFASITTSQTDDDAVIAEARQHLGPMNTSAAHYKWTMSIDGVPNDTLEFNQLLDQDNGLYACNVTTLLGSDLTLVLVNVKDRWAALWPFIGIVIEVGVLVAAILFYERHQMRSKASTAGVKVENVNAEPGRNTISDESPSTAASKLRQQQQQQPLLVQNNNTSVTAANEATGQDATDVLLGNGPTPGLDNDEKDPKHEDIRLRNSPKE